MKLFRRTASVYSVLLLVFVGSAVAQDINFDFYDGVTHYENREFEKAIESLKKAVANSPELTDAYIYLASAHLGAEQFDQTIQTARKGLDIAPNHVRLLLLKAEGYYRSDYRKAISVYHEIEEILKEEPSQQKDGVDLNQVQSYLARLYQRRANDFYNADSVNKAIEDYTRARKFSPDNMNIYNNLGYILLKEERWDEAVEVLQEATELFPDAERILFMKGQVYKGAGQLDKMVGTYHQLYQKDKNNLNYAVIYGQSLMAANQAQKANTFLKQLIEDHPEEERLYEILKNMNEQRFDFGAKRNVLKLQRNAFPEDQAVAEELARTHLLIREYNEARNVYDSLATATQDLEYSIQAARTWLYEENYEKAAAAYQSLAGKWPDKANVLAETAIVSEQTGDTSRARELYKRAYELGKEPEVAVRLIELLIPKGETKEALTYVRDLKGTDYSGVGKYYELIYGQGNIGKNKKAEKAQAAVLEIVQLYDDYQEKIKELSSKALKGHYISKPPLLQIQRSLDRIEQYVNEWYGYVSSSFTYKEASQILGKVIAEYPSSPKLHLFSGKMAIEHDDITRGIQSLEEAARLGAQDPEVHVTLGDTYVQLGKIQPAILSYERALTLDREYENAYRRLVKVSQNNDLLNKLCDRWMIRYGNNRDNNMLKEYLIEALHKANRKKDAIRVIGQD